MEELLTPTIRVRLDLSYDGTAFHGWARQPGLRTVADELEQALVTVLRAEQALQLTVAGRTDAGVHARGQVAHVDLPREQWLRLPGRSDRPPAVALTTRLNGVLGHGGEPRGAGDVVVRGATEVPAAFDARFSALWRRYSYRIVDAFAHRDPLRRREELWHHRELDVAAMDAAAATLLGEHDFAAYCKPREGATTIRTLQEFTWRRVRVGEVRVGDAQFSETQHGASREMSSSDVLDGAGHGASAHAVSGHGTPGGDLGVGSREVLVAHVRADAFCHSMVRSLVGACLAVGEGRMPVSWPAEVLAAATRDPRVTAAPAHGLTLEEVAYPEPGELEARARAARRVRTLPPHRGVVFEPAGEDGCC